MNVLDQVDVKEERKERRKNKFGREMQKSVKLEKQT